MTPEQEEAVRRALAAAAHDGGTHDPEQAEMPPEVAARLDRVLDGLAAPRVVPRLDARARRRHRALAGVAAAVVAAAAGIAAVAGGFGSSSGPRTEADRPNGVAAPRPTADATTLRSPRASAGLEGRTPRTAPEPRSLGGAGAGSAAGAARSALHRATLRGDVQRVVDALPDGSGRAEQRAGCPAPPTRPGDLLVAVRLDGRPGSLLVRAAEGGRQKAAVYSCSDSRRPLATTSVIAPGR